LSSIPRDKITQGNVVIDDNDIKNESFEEYLNRSNPLLESLPWWHEFYKRI